MSRKSRIAELETRANIDGIAAFEEANPIMVDGIAYQELTEIPDEIRRENAGHIIAGHVITAKGVSIPVFDPPCDMAEMI